MNSYTYGKKINTFILHFMNFKKFRTKKEFKSSFCNNNNYYIYLNYGRFKINVAKKSILVNTFYGIILIVYNITTKT